MKVLQWMPSSISHCASLGLYGWPPEMRTSNVYSWSSSWMWEPVKWLSWIPSSVKGPVLERLRPNTQANPSAGLQKTDMFLSSNCSALLTCQRQKPAFVSCVFISVGVTVFSANLGRLPLGGPDNTLGTQGKLNSFTFPCIMESCFSPVKIKEWYS